MLFAVVVIVESLFLRLHCFFFLFVDGMRNRATFDRYLLQRLEAILKEKKIHYEADNLRYLIHIMRVSVLCILKAVAQIHCFSNIPRSKGFYQLFYNCA